MDMALNSTLWRDLAPSSPLAAHLKAVKRLIRSTPPLSIVHTPSMWCHTHTHTHICTHTHTHANNRTHTCTHACLLVCVCVLCCERERETGSSCVLLLCLRVYRMRFYLTCVYHTSYIIRYTRHTHTHKTNTRHANTPHTHTLTLEHMRGEFLLPSVLLKHPFNPHFRPPLTHTTCTRTHTTGCTPLNHSNNSKRSRTRTHTQTLQNGVSEKKSRCMCTHVCVYVCDVWNVWYVCVWCA